MYQLTWVGVVIVISGILTLCISAYMSYMCVCVCVAEILGAVLKYLDRITLHGPVTLDKLMQIETKINLDFKLAHFSALDNGTFLEFILAQPDIKKV